MPDADPPDHEKPARRAKFVALVFVIVLAGFAVWVVNGIIADVKLQNCVLSGRRDCVEIAPATDAQ